MKKVLSTLLLSGLIVASSTTVFAENTNLPYVEGLGYEVNVIERKPGDKVTYGYDSGWKKFLGGDWRHGVNSKHVWSRFYHKSKTHKTTVRGAGGKYSYSGWEVAGNTAKASWEKAITGNKAWADVK